MIFASTLQTEGKMNSSEYNRLVKENGKLKTENDLLSRIRHRIEKQQEVELAESQYNDAFLDWKTQLENTLPVIIDREVLKSDLESVKVEQNRLKKKKENPAERKKALVESKEKIENSLSSNRNAQTVMENIQKIREISNLVEKVKSIKKEQNETKAKDYLYSSKNRPSYVELTAEDIKKYSLKDIIDFLELNFRHFWDSQQRAELYLDSQTRRILLSYADVDEELDSVSSKIKSIDAKLRTLKKENTRLQKQLDDYENFDKKVKEQREKVFPPKKLVVVDDFTLYELRGALEERKILLETNYNLRGKSSGFPENINNWVQKLKNERQQLVDKTKDIQTKIEEAKKVIDAKANEIMRKQLEIDNAKKKNLKQKENQLTKEKKS